MCKAIAQVMHHDRKKTFLTETRVAIEQGQIRKGKEATDD
jgi:hypothetical protein